MLPLLLMRFIYALLAGFTDIGVFTLLTNWNAIVRLCMGVGMEFVMVVLYTATAFMPPGCRVGSREGRFSHGEARVWTVGTVRSIFNGKF